MTFTIKNLSLNHEKEALLQLSDKKYYETIQAHPDTIVTQTNTITKYVKDLFEYIGCLPFT